MIMTFQEIRIIATGPCMANQLRDVNTICKRSWYIAAHIWKIYDFKIEIVPFIINVSTELIDHNPTATTATTSFHGTSISLFQHLSTDNEGAKRGLGHQEEVAAMAWLADQVILSSSSRCFYSANLLKPFMLNCQINFDIICI
jgi:hypothetical protein